MARIILLFAVLITFAACNSSSSGVEGTTVNGFKYVHHIANEGAKPQTGDYVFFQVEMSNGDSITYDSRDQAPGIPGRSTVPQVVIPELGPESKPSPVIEALMVMAVGDSLTVYYPLDSLQGRRPPGYETAENILYHLVLTEIKTADVVQKEQEAEQLAIQAKLNEIKTMVDETLSKYKNGELADQLQKTESGLEYVIHEEGDGPQPNPGDMVVTNYYGVLESDGTMFDNSFQRGQEFPFPLGQKRVIAGWDEGFGLLKTGSKATFFIPYDLAYGASGRPPAIPEKADLVFYVELVGVQ